LTVASGAVIVAHAIGVWFGSTIMSSQFNVFRDILGPHAGSRSSW